MDVVLRTIGPDDLALLHGGDTEFNDFGPPAPLGAPPSPSLDEDGGGLAVLADGAVAGLVDWHFHQWGPTSASRCAEIGIWLRADARGRGIGRVAQARLVGLMFTHTAVARVEAYTDVDNVAERRALAAAGFIREGVLREAQWRGGARHDLAVYAVLRDDVRPAL